MFTRKLVTNVDAENPTSGDLELRNGTTVWTSDLQTIVAQKLRVRLSFFKGEWYLDAREGVPYFQQILGRKGVSDQTINAIISKVIRECPGVSTLEEITVVRDASLRTADVRFRARLEDGTVLDSRRFQPFIVEF